MKLKLSCLVIIVEIMCGGKIAKPKNTVLTVKCSGGSIMIWACLSAKSVGKISVINSKMNAQKYKQNPQENIISPIESF